MEQSSSETLAAFSEADLIDFVDDMMEAFELAMNAVLDVDQGDIDHIMDIVRDYVLYQYDLKDEED